MVLKNEKLIDVINYHSFGIAIKSKEMAYFVEAGKPNYPTRLPLSIDEIKYINTTSSAFKDGLLFFDEDIERDIYENELRIFDWEDILKPFQIEDIILNPTIEKLQRIIDITNVGIFEIIRGIFVKLRNDKNENISIRIEKIIEEKNRELQNKIYKTNIILKPKDVVTPISVEEVNSLKLQNEMMQIEIEKMKLMMDKLLKDQNNIKENQEDIEEKDLSIKKTNTKIKSKN